MILILCQNQAEEVVTQKIECPLSTKVEEVIQTVSLQMVNQLAQMLPTEKRLLMVK